jgi:hypothetical protein
MYIRLYHQSESPSSSVSIVSFDLKVFPSLPFSSFGRGSFFILRRSSALARMYEMASNLRGTRKRARERKNGEGRQRQSGQIASQQSCTF